MWLTTRVGVWVAGHLVVSFRLEEEKPRGQQTLNGDTPLRWEANSQGLAI